MHARYRTFFLLLPSIFLVWCVSPRKTFSQSPQLLQVDLQRGQLIGMPVHWGRYDAALLEPDGRLHIFDVVDVRRHQLLDQSFSPLSAAVARSQLQAELGPAFEITIAGPYVIATPVGRTQRWQNLFMSLLGGYKRFFEVRGWPLRNPDFPLIVIVFPDRRSFQNYASTQATAVPQNVVGSYFPLTNRCILFEIEGTSGKDWSETEATIVHEAVHQLAYNTGVHERLFSNALWFVEGLATMFEQRAVYDLNWPNSTAETRMLASRKKQLQPLLKESAKLDALLRSIVATDELFRISPTDAYALAWGLTFYLTERTPGGYRNFVAIQSQRGFGAYEAGDRVSDFRTAFGLDPSLLAIQIQRLFAE